MSRYLLGEFLFTVDRDVLAAAGSLRVAPETVPLDGVTAAWGRQVRGEAGGRIVLLTGSA